MRPRYGINDHMHVLGQVLITNASVCSLVCIFWANQSLSLTWVLILVQHNELHFQNYYPIYIESWKRVSSFHLSHMPLAITRHHDWLFNLCEQKENYLQIYVFWEWIISIFYFFHCQSHRMQALMHRRYETRAVPSHAGIIAPAWWDSSSPITCRHYCTGVMRLEQSVACQDDIGLECKRVRLCSVYAAATGHYRRYLLSNIAYMLNLSRKWVIYDDSYKFRNTWMIIEHIVTK